MNDNQGFATTLNNYKIIDSDNCYKRYVEDLRKLGMRDNQIKEYTKEYYEENYISFDDFDNVLRILNS